MPSGTLACPETGRHRRLAVQLRGMIPGATAIRVSLNDPAAQWPHPYARATNADGTPIRLSRIKAGIAARWVLRTWPDADWTRPHTLDLATGQLVPGGSHSVTTRSR
ncbi:transcriptional regulator [Kitasatospora sp. NPDC050463]|uniref:transcriptional regulator n=1 Tax=Kitasatospora sp. NPDC050463 TaxID=3155786 RepID=UPI00340CBFCD